jgi:hypothetical protein
VRISATRAEQLIQSLKNQQLIQKLKKSKQ